MYRYALRSVAATLGNTPLLPHRRAHSESSLFHQLPRLGAKRRKSGKGRVPVSSSTRLEKEVGVPPEAGTWSYRDIAGGFPKSLARGCVRPSTMTPQNNCY